MFRKTLLLSDSMSVATAGGSPGPKLAEGCEGLQQGGGPEPVPLGPCVASFPAGPVSMAILGHRAACDRRMLLGPCVPLRGDRRPGGRVTAAMLASPGPAGDDGRGRAGVTRSRARAPASGEMAAAMSGVMLRALRAALPLPAALPAARRLRTAVPRPAFAKELFLGSLRKVRGGRRLRAGAGRGCGGVRRGLGEERAGRGGGTGNRQRGPRGARGSAGERRERQAAAAATAAAPCGRPGLSGVSAVPRLELGVINGAVCTCADRARRGVRKAQGQPAADGPPEPTAPCACQPGRSPQKHTPLCAGRSRLPQLGVSLPSVCFREQCFMETFAYSFLQERL